MGLRRVLAGVFSTALCLTAAIWAPGEAAGTATSAVSLLVPSSTAFSMLGRSCGGIQEQAFATGFGPDGYPAGDVYLQTRCGGSGRGGGYHVTTYSAWAAVTWDFGGAVRAAAKLATAPTVSATFTATDTHSDTMYNTLTAVNVTPANCTVGNTTYCTYRAYLSVPAPGSPTAVAATQSGDTLLVTWTAATAGGLPASSTVKATPSGSGTTLTATVAGTATSASLAGVRPSTTYAITVNDANASGTSADSAPFVITTRAASTVPGVPTSVSAAWTPNGSSILVRWTAPTAGDSPIDDYQVGIAEYDPTGAPTVIDAGTATATTATGFSNVPDWSVQIRAHNAAGWSAWSARVILGGL
jgi:hypothetical protein